MFVPAAERVGVGRDDERDAIDAGVGRGTESVIEERTAPNRHQRFVAGVGGAPLRVIEHCARIRFAHARPQAARQDHRSTGLPHGSVGYMWRIGTGAAVFQAPRVKSGNCATADFFATDCTLRPTTALIAAAS